jgi:hypothetical protein
MRLPYHSKLLERKVYTDQQYSYINTLSTKKMRVYLPDLWYPQILTSPNKKNEWESVKIIVSSEKLKELDELTTPQRNIIVGDPEIISEMQEASHNFIPN